MYGDRIGADLRLLRQRRCWRQADLAERAGCSQSDVSRAERGQIEAMPLGKLEALAKALGARLVTNVAYQGERLDRLRDARHAELVDELARWLGARRWLVLPEVSFAIYGERGSIDLLAFHPATHMLLVVEVKTRFGDVQETLGVLDRKGRLARRIAGERGWVAREVGILLAAADTTTNRRTVAAFDATFRASLPSRGSDVRRQLRAPDGRAFRGLMFAPGSRRVTANGRRRIRRGRSGGLGARCAPERASDPR